MSKLDKIRDKLAENFWNYIGRNSDTLHAKTIFKHGFDLSSNEWEKIVDPLLDALTYYSCNAVDPEQCKKERACIALENYRKSV